MTKEKTSAVILSALLVIGFIVWRVSIALYEEESLEVSHLVAGVPSSTSGAERTGSPLSEASQEQESSVGVAVDDQGIARRMPTVSGLGESPETAGDSLGDEEPRAAATIPETEADEGDDSSPMMIAARAVNAPVEVISEDRESSANNSELAPKQISGDEPVGESLPFRFPLEGEVPEAFVTAGISAVVDGRAYIYFPAGSEQLSPSAEGALRALAESIEQSASGDVPVSIASFLDIRETSRPELSFKRIREIQKALEPLTTKSLQFQITPPVVEESALDESSWQERMKARRVELTFSANS